MFRPYGEDDVTYLRRLHYHRNAARREDQAASRTADHRCARIHNDLATMHRSVAAQLEAVYVSLREAFGDEDASVPAEDDRMLTAVCITPELTPIIPRHLSRIDWPADMG